MCVCVYTDTYIFKDKTLHRFTLILQIQDYEFFYIMSSVFYLYLLSFRSIILVLKDIRYEKSQNSL